MTIERGNNERDELVSKSYRTLADERTPDHLNEKVLRMATNPHRSDTFASPLLAAWFKPIALAATVGITLAIVIEVTQVGNLQDGDTVALTRPSEAMPVETTTSETAKPESVRDRFIPQGTDVIAEAENFAKARVGPNQVNNDIVNERQELAAPASSPPAAEAATPDEAQARVEDAVSDQGQPEAEVSASEVAKRYTEVRISDQIQRQSSNAANVRSMAATATDDFRDSEASREIDPTVAISRLRVQDKSTSIGARACNCSARKTAESWFACIEKLSESGNVDGAARENKAFEVQYPDFLPTK